MTDPFFVNQGGASRVKACIVQESFDVWAKIICSARSNNEKIAYVDLYSGPGRYEDGSMSTPLMVVEKALENERITKSLIAVFNDKDENNTETLKKEICKIKGIEKLEYKIYHEIIDENTSSYFENLNMIPTFTFLDPFGYVGLTLKLVDSLINSWGCDCLFFFNYNRINAALDNRKVDNHINALFGKERANILREKASRKSPFQRQTLVLDAMIDALGEAGKRYVIPFGFKNDGGRLTHYLIFVSKNFMGYKVVKDIMAKYSSSYKEDVASFMHDPKDSQPLQQQFFEFESPIRELENMLLSRYAGQIVSMDDIYRQHSVGLPYVKKNYRSVLCSLEDQGRVAVSDPDGKTRRKGSFPDRLKVTFPGGK